MPASTTNHPIIKLAYEMLEASKPDHKCRQAMLLLTSLQNRIAAQETAKDQFDALPPMNTPIIDEDSILIEWCFDDFRLGFNVEEDESENSWFLVTTQKLGDIHEYGYLNKDNQEAIMLFFLQFVEPLA